MNPPLTINGIDFNKKLDKEKEFLHTLIDVRRWYPVFPTITDDMYDMTQFILGKWDGICGIPMQIARPKHPFIITDNDRQA